MALAACAPAAPGGVTPAPLWGFTGPWDPRSDSMLALAAPHLDVAVTGWIALDTATGAPRALYRDITRERKRFPPRRTALVTSWLGTGFHPATVRALAADPARLAASADSLARLLRAGRYRGVVLDLEGHDSTDIAALRAVTAAFAAAARAAGAGPVTLAVPAWGGAYLDAGLLALPDRLLVMLYDQHWSGSSPGPVAAPAWVDAALTAWRTRVPPERLVAALPLYGYVWRNAAPGTVLSHSDLPALVREAGRVGERDTATSELVVRGNGGLEAWFVDAEALHRLRTVVKQHEIAAVALWRLGLEEPMLWLGWQEVN